MQETCIKCGHTNPATSGADSDACPKCGAIYAKVQQLAAQVPRRSSVTVAPVRNRAHFIDRLRDESLYPTFRKVITIFHMLGQVLAVLVFLGGLIGGYKSGSVGAMVGATVAALFMSIFFRVAKEASLMLADMSDATVRMAQQAEGDD